MALYDSQTHEQAVRDLVGLYGHEAATKVLSGAAPRIAALSAVRTLHHASVAVAAMGAEHVEEVHLLMDVRALLNDLADQYQRCL